jgi:hypothetical protein
MSEVGEESLGKIKSHGTNTTPSTLRALQCDFLPFFDLFTVQCSLCNEAFNLIAWSAPAAFNTSHTITPRSFRLTWYSMTTLLSSNAINFEPAAPTQARELRELSRIDNSDH